MNGEVVVRMDQKRMGLPYDVFGSDERLVGSFIPKPRADNRGREHPGNWTSPFSAEGLVRVNGDSVARVDGGALMRRITGQELAVASATKKGALKLRVADDVEPSLRLMAIGWVI